MQAFIKIYQEEIVILEEIQPEPYYISIVLYLVYL